MIDNEVQFKPLKIDGYGSILVGSDGSIIAKKGKMTPSVTNSKGYLRVHIGDKHYAVQWCTNIENKRHAVQNNLISSKVSPDDVRTIRSMYETGKYTSYADIGVAYDLSYSMIGYIVRGDSWRI